MVIPVIHVRLIPHGNWESKEGTEERRRRKGKWREGQRADRSVVAADMSTD